MNMMKYALLAFVLTAALSAQAVELSPEQCSAVADLAKQVTEQRDHGVSLEDTKERLPVTQPDQGSLLPIIAEWVYAEPTKSPVEMAARFWSSCSRNRGDIEQQPPRVEATVPLEASQCRFVASLSQQVYEEIAGGHSMGYVLVQIWSSDYDDSTIHVVNQLAELTKQIYTQPEPFPGAHTQAFLTSCLKRAGQAV